MPHADYLAAPPARRLTRGNLRKCWTKLKERVQRAEPGEWVGYVLASGAHVALRRTDDGSLELQLYRKERPAVADGAERWRREVDTFARVFDVQSWERTDGADGRGRPRSTLLQPRGLL